MKIEIEIPDEEIREAARAIVAERIANKMIHSEYGEGRFYRNTIKEIVRECIRGDIENLSDHSVTAAAKSIENRAVKKLIDKLGVTE